jgi:tRNA threonylcarbamoyladenosine biosynthesis protein TsaB
MLLAIDTATHRASIALHDGTILRGECTWEAVRRHTVTLVPHIAQMLEASEITPVDLTALAVNVGPGSYTGVRIGVAVAKGLALSLHLPLVPATTLEILVAAQPPDERPLYALYAAGRKRVGSARYAWVDGRWRPTTEVEVTDWPEFATQLEKPAVVVGEVGKRGHAALEDVQGVELPPPARHLRRAGYLAELAWQRLRAGEAGELSQVVPIYAR